jgi:DNA-binding MurR/RpiR family transcriptional regulator
MKLAIVGTGLIGASVGLAAKRADDTYVVGYDPERESLEEAGERGAIDESARTIEDAVAEHYDRLSPSQRRVIDRLLMDTRYGAMTSAPELAAEVGVSESTVTRAAQALGFAGYPDLRAHLRARLGLVGRLPERIQASVADLSAGPAAEAAVRVMLEDAESVRTTAEDLDRIAFEQVVERLVRAERVHIFGSRGSHGLALMLCIGLRLLRPDVQLLHQAAGDLPDQLLGLGAGHALVAISFRRVDRAAVGALKHARRAGATTIGLVDSLSSPVARLADQRLVARLGPLRLMPSYAAGASLINALTTAVSLRSRKHVPDLRLAERLWDEFGTYAET